MREPLFIRYANSKADTTKVIMSFIDTADDPDSLRIAKEILDKGVPDLSQFKSDFRNCLKDLQDNGPDQGIVHYLNSYMKPSLEELVEENKHVSYGDNKRSVIIKDGEAPWVEALICYNLALYIKGYGFETVKSCKTCKKFFTHKGKYASYCSDGCKQSKRGNSA